MVGEGDKTDWWEILEKKKRKKIMDIEKQKLYYKHLWIQKGMVLLLWLRKKGIMEATQAKLFIPGYEIEFHYKRECRYKDVLEATQHKILGTTHKQESNMRRKWALLSAGEWVEGDMKGRNSHKRCLHLRMRSDSPYSTLPGKDSSRSNVPYSERQKSCHHWT